jgi:hypothetical protein
VGRFLTLRLSLVYDLTVREQIAWASTTT